MSVPKLTIVSTVEEDEVENSKEQYVINYLKSVFALEEAIEPYKEQKKELRAEFIENGWLTRDEIWPQSRHSVCIRRHRVWMTSTICLSLLKNSLDQHYETCNH